ncbi:MAG: SH3 domain-containing protein [Spirochaetes bacterium]|nr:SH3 domain-containing protein [Spirochaetota bacterium]
MKTFFARNFKFINTVIILLISGLTLFPAEDSNLSARESYQKKIVTTKAGLNLRETADTAGKKKGVIPFGETVEITEINPAEVTIAGKTGRWVKVKWKKMDGWAFDAFLGEPPSELLEHFRTIAVNIQGGCDCSFRKAVGQNKMSGDCGNSEATALPVDKPVIVKGNMVTFEYEYWECAQWDDDEDDPSCTESQTILYECSIEGAKILDTRRGGTLTTDVKCKITRKKTDKTAN